MPTRLSCAGMHAHASLGNLHGEILLLGGSGSPTSFFECVGYFGLEYCLSPFGIDRRLLAVGHVFFLPKRP